ncbi:FT-interacting protein 3-like [Wolffia australiana]
MQKLPPEAYTLRETTPHLGGNAMAGNKLTTAYDLVEQMQYLYVRVVKAKDLPFKDSSGSCDAYVEVKLGNHKGLTRHVEKKANPEWNQVFSFSKDRVEAGSVEVVVKDKDSLKDDLIGRVVFELAEVPRRVPPDSPLAPQWYRLDDSKGNRAKGEIMLAVWMGTQADEAFPEAWHSDAAPGIKSKVYLSPRLWYLRVNVIEAQDLAPSDKPGRFPELLARVALGSHAARTRVSQRGGASPLWNEDLMFVAAEPFEEPLVLTVEEKLPGKEQVLGKAVIPLSAVERRLDAKPVGSRWVPLEGEELNKERKLPSRVHLRVCLEGGYHVLDESTHYSSDLRATAKQLWRPPIGVLELGILGAQGLQSLKTKDGRGSSDAYCVAKYGQKWVRTRTAADCSNPRWNEQYHWEVYDPCTVVTVGVFDSGSLHGGGGELRVGKVRIRLSTLETDRVYAHSYPLLALHPSGVKKMGELQLAVRFACSSLANMLHIYSQPLLPKMHYLHPLSVAQLDMLRNQATQIVAARLGRAEPPLRKEVVEYMLDVDLHMWSMRRSKANFFRIMGVFGGAAAAARWLDQICRWRNPVATVLIHLLFAILVLYPELILPTVFLYMVLIGVWRFRRRPRQPPHMDARLSHADHVHPDELDEEFDTFPSSRPPEVVRMRYDRLRSVAGRVQTVVGDLATQGERLQALLSWRDPRATALFVVFCLLAAAVLYVVPFQLVALLAGFYVLRHPRFRHDLPSVPLNFFRRLPARTDSML